MSHTKALLDRAELIRLKISRLHKWLSRSYNLCKDLDLENLTTEDLDKLEAFSARFGRSVDILVRQYFRTLDILEDRTEGSVIDVLNRAEKRGLIDSAIDFREMRVSRNNIAHEYLDDEGLQLASLLIAYAPTLLETLKRAEAYEIR